MEGRFQLPLVMYIALSMARGTHQWFYYTGESYLIRCLLEFLIGLGVMIFGGAQP